MDSTFIAHVENMAWRTPVRAPILSIEILIFSVNSDRYNVNVVTIVDEMSRTTPT
jgi:hypothetical protein